jgi:hypothetical protein
MSFSPYIESLRKVFRELHHCDARHVETIPVIERFEDKIVWEGEVEVFDLIGHPRASTGYAWADDKDKGSGPVCLLELPPVISPETAVQAAIAGKLKEQKKTEKSVLE